MNKRAFFLTSVLLGIVALISNSIAYDQIMAAQHLTAGRLSVAAHQQVHYTPDPEAVRLSSSSRILNLAGLIFTVCCFAFFIVALVRREPGWYSIPIMLLFFDIFVQLLA